MARRTLWEATEMEKLESRLLRGWKEIERYVGLDRKTIIAQGYPVRKARTGRVFAYRGDLRKYAELELYRRT